MKDFERRHFFNMQVPDFEVQWQITLPTLGRKSYSGQGTKNSTVLCKYGCNKRDADLVGVRKQITIVILSNR